jgi:ubiquinol-cytochrome c reductase iron-sulfur subunit
MDREGFVKRRATPPLIAAGLATVAVVLVTVWAWVVGPGPGLGVLISVVLVLGGLVLASVGRVAGSGQEDRHQKGPGLERRRLLMGAGAVLGMSVGGALAIPAALRTRGATDRLASTAWTPGARLVTGEGRVIAVDSIRPGSLLTAFPEGLTEAVSSQTLVVGMEPVGGMEPGQVGDNRVATAEADIVAYSKLCTHMACPVGLYQERQGTVVCPCHQAVFDLRHGGRVLRGPAGRSLPMLPLGVDGAGHLIAMGDFTDAVGTGFWGRNRP